VKIFLLRTSKGSGYASTQTIKDGLKFSSEIGFTPLILKDIRSIAKLILNYPNIDIILAIYPYICSPLRGNSFRMLEHFFIREFVKNKTFILYVVDLPIHQNIAVGNCNVVDEKSYHLERKLFESADIICVFNKLMKKTIQEHTFISDEKFVEFEILDYGLKIPKSKKVKFRMRPIKLAFGGNLNRRLIGSSISLLPKIKDVVYEFFGINGEWIKTIKRGDIKYCGVLQPEKFMEYISNNAHFGLIFGDLCNTYLTNYHNIGTTSKFSAYLAAGVPILSPSCYSYISYLIKKYEIGYSFPSFDKIPKIIDNLTESEYEDIRNNCSQLGEKIRNGYFFKKTVSLGKA